MTRPEEITEGLKKAAAQIDRANELSGRTNMRWIEALAFLYERSELDPDTTARLDSFLRE